MSLLFIFPTACLSCRLPRTLLLSTQNTQKYQKCYYTSKYISLHCPRQVLSIPLSSVSSFHGLVSIFLLDHIIFPLKSCLCLISQKPSFRWMHHFPPFTRFTSLHHRVLASSARTSLIVVNIPIALFTSINVFSFQHSGYKILSFPSQHTAYSTLQYS